MTLKTDTEIICFTLPEFFELSNHVSGIHAKCTISRQKIQKFSDSFLTRYLPH